GVRRGLDIREKSMPGSPSVAFNQTRLGSILLARGRADDAEAACGRARTALESRPESSRTLLASSLLCLGEARLAAGDLEAAGPLLGQALRIREAAAGPDHPWVAEALTARARLLHRQ